MTYEKKAGVLERGVTLFGFEGAGKVPQKRKSGPLVKWLRQRPLTPLTSVRIRYGSPLKSKLRIVRFRLKPKAHSLRCFFVPNRKRFAGLRFGERAGW